MHVHGEHGPIDHLAEAAAVERKLSDFHGPVGGKRFRPSPEDLVEFVIVEDLADKHDGWQDAIDEHRERWYESQLKAAVRRSPDVARAALREIDEGNEAGGVTSTPVPPLTARHRLAPCCCGTRVARRGRHDRPIALMHSP